MGAIIGAFGGGIDSAAVVVTRVLRVIEAVTIRAAVGCGGCGATIAIGGELGVVLCGVVVVMDEFDPFDPADDPIGTN